MQMDHIQVNISLIALSLLSISAAANEDRRQIEPEGYIYGFGLGLNQEVYKDYDRRIIPLPIIGYRGKDLNVFGPFVSYDMLDVGNYSFSVQLKPRFQGFDEDDSDIFVGMGDRDFSMDLGLGVQYKKDNWRADINWLHDVLGKSKGYESNASLSYVWRYRQVFFEPSIGMQYRDSRMTDYYYGVQADEINLAIDRPQYHADSVLNQTASVSVVTPLWGGLSRFSVTQTWYGDAIADSPLTDSDSSLAFIVTYSRFFK
ncbi:structural protein MipA [Shewanella gelidii]|uniref:Structural protein MipA n=2 Tax=Shewanella gelidii TaxID=1642821 RepID=A0A917JIS8_9GAMM|nr:structural protein MipA [Shewanella gelidii]